jgi:hypothetical protein
MASKGKAAGKSDKGSRWGISGRWLIVGGVALVVLLAAIGGGAYALVSGGGAKKAAPPVKLAGHAYFRPECAPVHGARWVYPGPAKISSAVYESFAINYGCAQAKMWTKKLATLTVHVTKVGNPGKIPGPAGFNCEAWPDANNHAYAGGCQKGTKVAFGWNWNVANSRQVLIRNQDTGQYHMEQLAGADTETILRPLKPGHYSVEVLNTSGIGTLNGFTWSPPPGWTIHGIAKVTGAKCTLAAQTVTCSGKVSPPACLCAGNGGKVKIDLDVTIPGATFVKGKPTHYGTVGAKMRITRMTAVPYLIPATPAEAKKQEGV